MPKLKKIINRFELGAEALTGEWLPLVGLDGEPLGLALKCLSIDTEKYVKARNRELAKFRKRSRSAREKELPITVAELLAKEIVVDWYGYDPDGDEPDWEAELVDDDAYDWREMKEIFLKKPTVGRNTILEQVEAFIADPTNFEAGPDVGKSENT